MIVIAGWIAVELSKRADYLDGCVAVVEAARRAPGCLDFAMGADLVDDSRINIFERWESEDELMAFRESGPDDGQQSAISEMAVSRYEVSAERSA